MYKPDLALNNLQWLMSRKTKPDKTKPYNYVQKFFGNNRTENTNINQQCV